jgi:2-polyprenyl-3-methyl-5-hydroxy-6-metoxy-1,4-benzoquinol methylase
MSNEWDAYAAGWDDDQAARAYAEAAHASLLSVLRGAGRTLDDARVLDFGCGTGLLTERLAPACRSIVAVDTSPAMLAVLRAKADRNAWQHVTTSLDLPVAPGSSEVVVCSSVCSFLDDYPGTLDELVGLLVPGGVFVQWDWERDDADVNSHGLSRADVLAALSAAGLESTVVETAFEVPVGEVTMRPLIGAGVKP